MFDFVTSLPIDVARPLEYLEALQAYRDNAPAFVDALARAGLVEGYALAYAAATGNPMPLGSPIQSRDAFAMLQYGGALEIVQGPRERRIAELLEAEEEVGVAQAAAARSISRQLAARATYAFGGPALNEEFAREEAEGSSDNFAETKSCLRAWE